MGMIIANPILDPGVRVVGSQQPNLGKKWTWLPSGYVKIAIENGHRNSGFTHLKLWFSSSLCKRLPEGNVSPFVGQHFLGNLAVKVRGYCLRP